MKPHTTARDFFLYLGIFIGFYVSVTSFLILAFNVVDRFLPLAGEYAAGAGAIRGSIAALVVFFPSFLFLARIAHRDLASEPEKKDMWVRRWAIFCTLFAAGLAIAIDLSTLVYRFLGAEDLTLRFFLKVFLVLGAAWAAFRAALAELRQRGHRAAVFFAAGAAVAILAAAACGIAAIGSPNAQHAAALDSERVSDLASIQNELVYSAWERQGALPETLDGLNDPISGFAVPADPATGAPYGYEKLSTTTFELCATFDAASGNVPAPAMYPDTLNENWKHGAGYACFTRTIDPALYKPAAAK